MVLTSTCASALSTPNQNEPLVAYLCGSAISWDPRADGCLDKRFQDYVNRQNPGMIKRDVFLRSETVWATYEGARATYDKATETYNQAKNAHNDAVGRWNQADHTSVAAFDDYIKANDAYEEALHTHSKDVKSYKKAVEKYIKDTTDESSMGPHVESMSVYHQFPAVLGVLATVHLMTR